MYALAASAAGVGMLALAQPSQAKIVYTPANIQINVGGGLVYLDLNNDGVNDFQFYDVFSVQLRVASDVHSFSYLTVAPVQKSNRVYERRLQLSPNALQPRIRAELLRSRRLDVVVLGIHVADGHGR